VLILVVIAIPSFRLVYFEDRTQHADLTIKVTGHQWYWEYTYPDSVVWTSPATWWRKTSSSPAASPARRRQPDGGADRQEHPHPDDLSRCDHSFFIPSLACSVMPSGANDRDLDEGGPAGTYYGECNQICGTNHSMMPISVKALTPEAFAAWVTQAGRRHPTPHRRSRASPCRGGAVTGRRERERQT